MSGKGRTPKARPVRAGRGGARVVELFPDSGKRRYGKPLPSGVLPDGEEWHPQTVAWWTSLRTWPLLEHEPEVGWAFLIDTARLHHQVWAHGRLDLAAELRLRVCQFGSTPESRHRLGVSVRLPTDEPGSAASVMGTGDQAWRDARRRRLTGQEPETPHT